MTPSLTYFWPEGDRAQELLDDWVEPMCRRLGVHLRLAPPGANRATALAARRLSTFVVWDCSLDGTDRVYRAFTVAAKIQSGNLIVSRTPLPRNVLARHCHAPIHGETMENAQLAEWLEERVSEVLRGGREARRRRTRSAHYWMFENPADYFLSFRGTHQEEAEKWRDSFERAHGVRVRMVPPAEYSYPTEVVTRQQMWEGVARLLYEMTATGRVIVYRTDDYYDSFWTAGELLGTLWLVNRGPAESPRIEAAYVADGPDEIRRFDHRGSRPLLGTPYLTDELARRFTQLINNCDPVTTAPETRVPPRGLGRAVAFVVRRWGYHLPEFTSDEFWDDVRVPCPHCKPRGRAPGEVDWRRHMAPAEREPAVDHYGYFTATRDLLATGRARCPGCGNEPRLVNRRGDRTLWRPVLSTAADRDRPVIDRRPVWEVLV